MNVQKLQLNGFGPHDCGMGCVIWTGRVPDSLLLKGAQLEELWQLHPEEHTEIRIHGRKVPIPRWQQAYGADYHFSGQVNKALPVPSLLAPLHAWAEDVIDARLNGLLLNWYDGKLGHYIGAHRDSIVNMVGGAPIVTVSFGENRVFRLRQWRPRNKVSPVDFPVTAGSVVVMPYETNRLFTHEVPTSKKLSGRRASVTLRAFVESTAVPA